jgi:transposase
LGAALQADGETRSRICGLKHQKEKRSMDHFAGLDVSVKETSVCIVDDTGKIVREVKVASEPEALLAVLKNPGYHFKRIGLEAGPLSQWLYSALAEAELPVVCVETRHMRAVLKAQINKTDRNDARGIAQMMRVGLYRPVHVKTLRSQKLRMLLTHRKLLQSKAIANGQAEGPRGLEVDNQLKGDWCRNSPGAGTAETDPTSVKSAPYFTDAIQFHALRSASTRGHRPNRRWRGRSLSASRLCAGRAGLPATNRQ